MTSQEKLLYHQIHPVKLLTDFGTSFASIWLLWEARWAEAALVALVPSIVVTVLLVRFAELGRYRDSVLGQYVRRFMTRKIEAARFAGQIAAWAGAVAHVPWLVPLGYFAIFMAWANGAWVNRG